MHISECCHTRYWKASRQTRLIIWQKLKMNCFSISGANMASIRGKTYDHIVEQIPPIDKLGNQYLVTPLFPESKTITIVKVVGRHRSNA